MFNRDGSFARGAGPSSGRIRAGDGPAPPAVEESTYFCDSHPLGGSRPIRLAFSRRLATLARPYWLATMPQCHRKHEGVSGGWTLVYGTIRGVAQLGLDSAWFGTKRSKVQILSPRLPIVDETPSCWLRRLQEGVSFAPATASTVLRLPQLREQRNYHRTGELAISHQQYDG